MDVAETAKAIEDATKSVAEATDKLNEALPELSRNVWISSAVPSNDRKTFIAAGPNHAYDEHRKTGLDLVAYRNGIEHLSAFCEKLTEENGKLRKEKAGLRDSIKRLEKTITTHKITNTSNMKTIERLTRSLSKANDTIDEFRKALNFLGATPHQLQEIETFGKTDHLLFPNAENILAAAHPKPKPRRKAR